MGPEVSIQGGKEGGFVDGNHHRTVHREVLFVAGAACVRKTRQLSIAAYMARMWTCATRIPSTQAQVRKTAKAVRTPNRSWNGTGSARRYLKRVVSATEADGEGVPIEKCASVASNDRRKCVGSADDPC